MIQKGRRDVVFEIPPARKPRYFEWSAQHSAEKTNWSMILRIFLKGANGKLLGKIMADSAVLSIDNALERLNMSREKQKIILTREQEKAVKELLAGRDVMETLDCSMAKEIAKVFLSREGGRLCFTLTSEAKENISY